MLLLCLLALLRRWAALSTLHWATLATRRETTMGARSGAAGVMGHCRCVILRLSTVRTNYARSLECSRACRGGNRRMTAVRARSQRR